jgi:DNA-binding GntR family transcriptional regulator
LEALRNMVEADQGLLGDGGRLAHSNRLFHRQIHHAARNRFLDLMLDNMRLSLVLLGRTTLSLPERGAAAVEEHAAIVAAIAARDLVAAEAAARQHIRNAFQARLALENRTPDLP